MASLKRNYGLFISSLISLALLGFAGYYLLIRKASADDASDKLEKATGELKRLYGRNPFPNTENINAAKQDEKRAETFSEEVKRFFNPPPYPTQLNNREFGIRLAGTVNQLQRMASASGVKLPKDDYQFSFESQ